MSIIIAITGLLNIMFLYLFARKTSPVLILMQIYWFFWMFLSSFSLTGLQIPTGKTYFLYILMLTSVTLGSGLFSLHTFISKRKIKPKFISILKIANKRKEKYYFIFLCLFISPIVTFFFLKSLYIQFLTNESMPSDYRSMAFGLFGESILFGKNIYLYYYASIIQPLLYASLFLGVAFLLRYKKKRILLFAFFLVAMDTLMLLGRFGFYYILIILVLILVIVIFRNPKAIFGSVAVKATLVSILLIVLFVFTLGYMRSAKRTFNFSEFVNVYIIDYHTESFSMFDHELKEESSTLHQRTYGRTSLGGIERMVTFALNRVFKTSIPAESNLLGENLHKSRLLGYTFDGKEKYYNAFGSVLFNLYKDGGIVFIIFMGILFGYLVSKYSASFISLNAYSLSMLAALFFIGIFGIFKPILSESLQMTILFLIVFWRL
ncbi:oligosaccharide repeat unit polymerase [Leptospira yasudae]|uniref:O-antigen polymerase n=1 Tax=Leptospira yasudae TaxID=2202201 RepID=UPI000E59CA69|nr:O-antigen polymerase [Leptospira yasudae]RHX91215.1 oligosaccharide repeat unit polymerase [Leptospira yasudae]